MPKPRKPARVPKHKPYVPRSDATRLIDSLIAKNHKIKTKKIVQEVQKRHPNTGKQNITSTVSYIRKLSEVKAPPRSTGPQLKHTKMALELTKKNPKTPSSKIVKKVLKKHPNASPAALYAIISRQRKKQTIKAQPKQKGPVLAYTQMIQSIVKKKTMPTTLEIIEAVHKRFPKIGKEKIAASVRRIKKSLGTHLPKKPYIPSQEEFEKRRQKLLEEKKAKGHKPITPKEREKKLRKRFGR